MRRSYTRRTIWTKPSASAIGWPSSIAGRCSPRARSRGCARPLALPVTLAIIEYAAFGPAVASGKLPPIRVLVLDEDRTLASALVPQLFTGGGPLKDMFETAAVADRAAARALFQRNDASALIV